MTFYINGYLCHISPLYLRSLYYFFNFATDKQRKIGHNRTKTHKSLDLSKKKKKKKPKKKKKNEKIFSEHFFAIIT